jgi:site-specific DNA-methyltransferase (adenine-specific)
MIAWVYGSGFPKSLDVSKAIEAKLTVGRSDSVGLRVRDGRTAGTVGTNMHGHRSSTNGDKEGMESAPIATPEAQQWAGWGTALKPALEPVTMARKPFPGTVAANVLEHGTGAINVDGCRIDAEPRSFSGTPNRHGGQLAGGGEKGEMRPDWTETRGRWPANLITDGSDEVVGLFPQTTSTGGSGPASRGYSSDGRTVSGSCAATGGFGDTGSAARFFYTAKASKADRDEGCEELEAGTAQGMRSNAGPALVGEDRNRTQARNTHPTVKPTDLMRYLCRLVTPPGGIVLDPFMGSGSTGKAAMLEGFGFIGIEREAAYHAIAERRIRQAAAAGHQPSLLLA